MTMRSALFRDLKVGDMLQHESGEVRFVTAVHHAENWPDRATEMVRWERPRTFVTDRHQSWWSKEKGWNRWAVYTRQVEKEKGDRRESRDWTGGKTWRQC